MKRSSGTGSSDSPRLSRGTKEPVTQIVEGVNGPSPTPIIWKWQWPEEDPGPRQLLKRVLILAHEKFQPVCAVGTDTKGVQGSADGCVRHRKSSWATTLALSLEDPDTRIAEIYFWLPEPGSSRQLTLWSLSPWNYGILQAGRSEPQEQPQSLKKRKMWHALLLNPPMASEPTPKENIDPCPE